MKKLAAVLLTLSMLCCTACGTESTSEADSSRADSISGLDSTTEENSRAPEESDESDSDDVSESTSDSEAESSNASDKQTSQSGGNGSGGSGASPSVTPSGDTPEEPKAPAQQATPSGGGASGNSEKPAADSQVSSEAVEIKTITLKGNSADISGSGIAARGSRIGITKGGTYRITGQLTDGQLEINTTKKVVLQLNGMSIRNSAGSAINALDAKRLTIELMPGTTNTLEDGGTHDADNATLFSNDTVEICGSGTLEIKANYAHGIKSDDDIVMTSGNVNITSKKTGLYANDNVEINGGNLFCDAETNGIKCKNTVCINGGYSALFGGVKEEKGAIICEGALTVNGGTLFAVGNVSSVPVNGSRQNVMVMHFQTARAAGVLSRIENNHNNILTITSPRPYSMVLFSTAGMTSGLSYSIYEGGTVTGGSLSHHVTTGGSYAGGTKIGSYASTGRVTTFTLPS